MYCVCSCAFKTLFIFIEEQLERREKKNERRKIIMIEQGEDSSHHFSCLWLELFRHFSPCRLQSNQSLSVLWHELAHLSDFQASKQNNGVHFNGKSNKRERKKTICYSIFIRDLLWAQDDALDLLPCKLREGRSVNFNLLKLLHAFVVYEFAQKFMLIRNVTQECGCGYANCGAYCSYIFFLEWCN